MKTDSTTLAILAGCSIPPWKRTSSWFTPSRPTSRLTAAREISSAVSPSGCSQYCWDTGTWESSTASGSSGGRLHAAWRPIAAMVFILTWLSHGSWAEEPVVRWPCAASAVEGRAIRIANSLIISGILVLTSGTKPLRLVAILGVASVFIAIAVSVYTVGGKLFGNVEVPGWASLVVVVSFFSGLILFSLGVLAEYLGIAITMALGRPLYLITSRPNRGVPRR